MDKSLKHKRQKFTIDGLIGTLDVEEKARVKHMCGKGVVGGMPTLFKRTSMLIRTTPTRATKSHHRYKAKTKGRLNVLPHLRRREDIAMCAGVQSTCWKVLELQRC